MSSQHRNLFNASGETSPKLHRRPAPADIRTAACERLAPTTQLRRAIADRRAIERAEDEGMAVRAGSTSIRKNDWRNQ